MLFFGIVAVFLVTILIIEVCWAIIKATLNELRAIHQVFFADELYIPQQRKLAKEYVKARPE